MYIFVSLLYSTKRRIEIGKQVKTALESAANTYQWGILRGLKDIAESEEIKIINSVPMGNFPRKSKIFIEKSSNEFEDCFEIDNIGYLNLPWIKQRQRTKGLISRLKNILRKNDEKITVILYSLYNPYLKALDKIKRKYTNFQYLIIVPDLPCEYGIESQNKLKRKLNRRIGYQSLSLAKKADGYIFLTEDMNDVLNKKGVPYKIIEGVAQEVKTIQGEKSSIPTILYTGNLNRVFGVGQLIDAYRKLEKGSCELWIAGDGDMKQEILKICKQDANLKFFGYCSKEDIEKLQAQAWILANPRSRNDDYVKYSFPSKTMEYLASGKPVAMNKLPCIPCEYYQHLFFFEEETPQSMAETFKYILELSTEEIEGRSKKQRTFIMEEKSGQAQASKIKELKENFFKVN